MTSNAIIIGDQHFKINNIPEVDEYINKIEIIVKNKKPDFIVLLGDMLDQHEKIHTVPLNKAFEFIDKMRNIAKTFILVGNHDMCLGKNTPVLLYDGNIKMSQYIENDDKLINENGEMCTVSSICSGRSNMYKIKQMNADDYIVNENHMLSLIHKGSNNNIIDISVKNFFKFPKYLRDRFNGFKCPNVYNENVKIKSSTINNGNIEVEFIGVDDYYGFSVDKTHRFLLGDFTVTHNCNNQVFLTPDHWLNALKEWENLTVVDTVIKTSINGNDFVFCPYVFPGRFEEALNLVLNDDWKDVKCIFCHQEFEGCKMGAIISIDGDRWTTEYPNIISGHIHKNQTINNIYYPGSSMQVSFGETDKNILSNVIFDKEKSDYILEEIEIDLPRKKILYMDVEELENFNLEKTKDKLKITISGSYEEFKTLKKTKKYKEITNDGVQIVFKTKKKEMQKMKDHIEEQLENQKTNNNISDGTNFMKILDESIKKEKNPYLFETFEYVINDRNVEHDDVIYI